MYEFCFHVLFYVLVCFAMDPIALSPRPAWLRLTMRKMGKQKFSPFLPVAVYRTLVLRRAGYAGSPNRAVARKRRCLFRSRSDGRDAYGRNVPERVRTIVTSPLLTKPSVFTSERKFVASGRLTGTIARLQGVAGIHQAVATGITDQHTHGHANVAGAGAVIYRG